MKYAHIKTSNRSNQRNIQAINESENSLPIQQISAETESIIQVDIIGFQWN